MATENITKFLRAFIVLYCLSLVAACGGGGGGSHNPPPAQGGLSLNATGANFSAVQNASVPTTRTIVLTVTNPDAVFITVEWNEDWLEVDFDDAGNITLTIQTTALAIAAYHDTVTVGLETLDGDVLASSDLAITYNVTHGLSFPNETVYRMWHNPNAPVAPFFPTPIGGSDGNSWTASKDQNWITLTGTSGNLPGAITISYSPTGLAAGSYTGVVTLTPTAGAPLEVDVGLEVYSASLRPDPGVQVFTWSTGSSGTYSFTPVLYSDVGPLAWTAISSVSWLTLNTASGMAPCNVFTTIDASGVAPGLYEGVITFSASVGGTPVTSKIYVRLRVI